MGVTMNPYRYAHFAYFSTILGQDKKDSHGI